MRSIIYKQARSISVYVAHIIFKFQECILSFGCGQKKGKRWTKLVSLKKLWTYCPSLVVLCCLKGVVFSYFRPYSRNCEFLIYVLSLSYDRKFVVKEFQMDVNYQYDLKELLKRCGFQLFR